MYFYIVKSLNIFLIADNCCSQSFINNNHGQKNVFLPFNEIAHSSTDRPRIATFLRMRRVLTSGVGQCTQFNKIITVSLISSLLYAFHTHAR